MLPALDSLVDKSLVVVEELHGESRFRLLETIRHYASQRLDDAGELAATRDRHLDYVLAVAESTESELDRDKDAWCARLEPERDNLRAALAWGLAADDPDRGRRWQRLRRGYGISTAEARRASSFSSWRSAGRPSDRTILQAAC